MTDEPRSFFAPIPAGGIAKPLAVAMLWAFAVAVASGLVVGLAALMAGGAAGVFWLFDRSVSVSGAMTETLRIASWVVAPIGIAVTVWVAAYGSTKRGSVPRASVAAPAALGVAAALLFLDSSGLLAASLALGWALAIPADSPTRAAGRGLPLLIAALLVPKLSDLSTTEIVEGLVVSPLVAAAVVLLADAPWRLLHGSERAEE